jgi:ATP-binding cassette subfamily B protein
MSTPKKRYVPPYVEDAYAVQGVPPEELIYAIHPDLAPDGDFADTYAAVSKENLYILYGEERVVKTVGARRIVADYRADRLETFALSDLGKLKTEKLLSTGRLVSTNEDKEQIVLTYSIGLSMYIERLINVITNIRENSDPLKDVLVDDALFCPKCGTRYPEPDRKLCPRCMDKVSITMRLMGFFKHYKAKVFTIMTVMLLSTACAILAPYVGTRLFLDEVLTIGGRYYGAILAVVLVIFLVKAVTVSLNILYSYVLARTIPWIVYDLKLRIFEAMQRLSVGFYTSKRTGNLMNRVSRDATNIYWFFVDGLPFLFVNVLMFLGIFTLMFVID